MPHLGERFDPGVPAEFAAASNKLSGDPGPAVSRMEHDPRKQDQLMIQGSHRGSFPASRPSKIAMPHRQALRWRIENANPDRFLFMPEQKDGANQSEAMAAVMPPSEVRPVGFGRGGDPHAVAERESFFLLESDRGSSMKISPER